MTGKAESEMRKSMSVGYCVLYTYNMGNVLHKFENTTQDKSIEAILVALYAANCNTKHFFTTLPFSLCESEK